VTREELLQDLNYARTLAEEGRHAPLIGGAYLVLFGVLLAVCYAAQFYILTSDTLPPDYAGFLWMGFGACAAIGVMALRGRTQRMPGVTSVGNKAERIVWNGVAIAIMVVVAGTVLRSIFSDNFGATDAIMAAGFGLYGVALFLSAGLSGHTWLRAFAWLAWSVSGTLWYFMGEPWAYIVAAIGSILVLLVPGVIMMRGEPSKVV
jgi:hypothetical protein